MLSKIMLTIAIGAFIFMISFSVVKEYRESIAKQHKEIVQLQMDKEEIKLHTDQLARIVTTQQYQIDVLAETLR